MRSASKDTKAYFNDANIAYTDSIIELKNDAIHFIKTGDDQKPTLFFVHGSPGSWDAYKRYLSDSLLLKKYRLIAIDRPGFGFSNYRQSKNLFEQVDIIHRFIDKIDNGNNIYLIGHSYGGPVIVQMAIERPSAYKEIVVLSGAVDPSAEKPEKWREIFIKKPLKYLVPGALKPSNDELWWLKKDLVTMKPLLGKLTCRVLIIHGTEDNLVPFSNATFMKNNFENAKSVRQISIDGANHFIPWEYFKGIKGKLLEL